MTTTAEHKKFYMKLHEQQQQKRAQLEKHPPPSHLTCVFTSGRVRGSVEVALSHATNLCCQSDAASARR